MDKLLKEVPEFNIKLDPVGIMRNMKDDPYEIMKRYANRIAHFHAKDIFRYGDDGWEIEPIVGMGQLKWNVMLGMLWMWAMTAISSSSPTATCGPSRRTAGSTSCWRSAIWNNT